LWQNDSWILHQDNVPAHNALSVKAVSGQKSNASVITPLFIRQISLHVWQFPKLKSALNGTHFESVEAIKIKSTEVLKALREKDFQYCFNQWKILME